MTRISKLLKDRIKELNIKYKDIAKPLGCTEQFVANWLRGAANPPPKHIYNISKILMISRKSIIDALTEDHREYLYKNSKDRK